MDKEKEEHMKIRIDKLILKHQVERSLLKEKLDLELNRFHISRKSGLETINHKYRNKKQNLENQQKTEKLLVSNNNLQRASNYNIITSNYNIIINNAFRNVIFVNI